MKKLIIAFIILFGSAYPTQAQQLQKPVLEIADGQDWDTCSFGEVANLNPAGDNFLAVRSGPGTNYEMIDKIRTGEHVWIFNNEGSWMGVVYGDKNIDCPPVKRTREYQGPGKKGWVFEKYIRQIAG
ncbi:MAG: SH3 domain-containing protein [Pseudomonadota bacterium]